MDRTNVRSGAVPSRHLCMNPQTPPSLPYGDKAALVKIDGLSGGIVFFIDGNRACTPMPVPDELLAMMDDVATAKVNHDGSAL